MKSGPESTRGLSRDGAIEAFRQMRRRLDSLERGMAEPIAIVGIGCRFPGNANGPERYWQLLANGVDAITEVPRDRWDSEAFYDREVGAPGKMVTRWAGFLDHLDRFDAEFFGISAREAAAMDPQQRLVLEVSYEAFEDAGIPLGRLARSRTGVYTAVMIHDYDAIALRDVTRIEPYTALGIGGTFLPNRLSYWYDLRGPSFLLDAACSGSLVAVHLACASLRSGETDLALAGGVNALSAPHSTVGMSSLGALSPTGRCHTFDAAADGYARGEGCGLVVLKRLSDAVAAGDRVYAVLRGSAVNHGGHTSGLTVPNVEAQEQLIREALRNAKVHSTQISYVEAHGTGTPLGDPIELAALASAFAAPDRGACAIGTVKTNFGHLEAAAGVAALIKTALCVQKAQIPPSLNFREPNLRIPFDDIPFRVQTTLAPWAPVGERLAGVSSFGMGGTNAHVIVGEAPPPTEDPVPEPLRYLLPLSTKSAKAMRPFVESYVAFLETSAPADLRSICASAATRRTQFAERLVVSGANRDELVQGLRAFLENRPTERVVTASRQVDDARPVFVFSGQGTQSARMARELFEKNETFRTCIESFSARFTALGGFSIVDELAADEAKSRMEDTAVAQACLCAIQVGLTEVWKSWGVVPAAVVGHSVGELAAAYVAGALGFDDLVRLAFHRGRILATTQGQGKMAAVRLGADEVAALLRERGYRLSIAAENGRTNTVLSGEESVLTECCRELEARGVRTHVLFGRHAFHSHQMEPCVPRLKAELQGLGAGDTTIPFASTMTGKIEPGTRFGADYWAEQVKSPVQFRQAITALSGQGFRTFVEIGSHPALSAEVSDLLEEAGAPFVVAHSLHRKKGDLDALASAAASLHVAGVPLRWDALLGAATAVSLPAHPFLGARHWLLDEKGWPSSTSASALSAAEAKEHAAGPSGEKTERARTRPEILTRLKELLAPLLGVPVEEVAADVPLIDMGADSIAVLDGAQRIQQEFRVRVRVQDVFGPLPTLDAIATYIFEKAPKPEARASRESQAEASNEARRALPAGAAESPKMTPPEAPSRSPAEARHMTALMERYLAKTPRSKAKKSASHARLADVRAAAGYRPSLPASLRGLWLETKEAAYPIVGARSAGSKMWDVDGNEYVDFVMGFGVHLFGHSPPFVMDALRAQIETGVQIGPQAEKAAEVAELVHALTGVERVAFCNTGTEAVMAALRLARATTGRSKIALFTGSYHGSFDGVLASIPMTLGTPPFTDDGVIVLEYGHPRSLEIIRDNAQDLAAVLVEPVQARRPDFQPREFLHELRKLTKEQGTALIFDEVLVGFRIAQGGAQSHFGVRADIVTYGKIAGGGLPIGVIGGDAAFIDRIDGGTWRYGDDSAPTRESVWFAGTFNKNPLTMAAARASLSHLQKEGPDLQRNLNARTDKVVLELNTFFAAKGYPIKLVHFASMFRFQMNRKFEVLFQHLNSRGIYIGEWRNFFLSTAHTDEDLARLVHVIQESLAEMEADGFFSERAPAAAPTPAEPPKPAGANGAAVVRPRKGSAPTRLRLFCFPYAGGGASVFRTWQRHVPEDVELCLVQPPGREGRADAPLVHGFDALLDVIERDLTPMLDVPFAFFGHSMGALVSFELARRLKDRRGPRPERLFLSAEPAPHVTPEVSFPGTLTDAELVALLSRFGVPKAATDNAAFLEELLPILRADLTAHASFSFQDRGPLDVPISVLAGTEDPLAREPEVAAWAKHTSVGCTLRMFPGDHYFIRNNEAAVVQHVLEGLSAIRRTA